MELLTIYTVSSLPAKDNIMVLGHIIQSGVLNNIMRLGYGSVDTGSNYAGRYSENGAADGYRCKCNHIW